MSIIRNVIRLARGQHKSLIMDLQEVRERICDLTIARHKYCELVARGDDTRYNHTYNEWMAGEMGRELSGLLYWLERAR